MERRVWRRRSVAWIMVMCMIWSMFTSIPVHAEETDENGGTELTGLMIQDWIDLNDEVPSVNPEAGYTQETTTVIQGTTIWKIWYRQDETSKLEDVSLDRLRLTYVGNATTDQGSAEVDVTESLVENEHKENGVFFNVTFNRTGAYRLEYLDENKTEVLGSVQVYVEYPEMGFYTSPKMTDESVIKDYNYIFDDCEVEEQSLYMIIKDISTTTLNEEESNGRGAPFRIDTWDGGSSQWITDKEEVQKYISYERVEGTENVYKITLHKNMDFGISAAYIVKTTTDGITNTREDSSYVNVNYQQKVKGLVLKDNIEWDDGPVVPDYAEFAKESYADVMGSTLYLAYRATEEAEPEEVSVESLHLYDEDGVECEAAVRENEYNSALCDITFPNVGEYTLALQDDNSNIISKVYLHVDWPEAAIYNTSEQTIEGLMHSNELVYSDEANRELYITFRQSGNVTYEDVNIVLNAAGAAIAKVEPVLEGQQYKLTINEGENLNFRMDMSYNRKDKWDASGEKNIQRLTFYINNADQTGTTYTDGLEHMGYAGCYIQPYEYKDTHTIDYENGMPRYWVHADTIQGVSDKLASLAAGEEMLFYDAEEMIAGNPEAVKATGVKNTGYIHINVSHFGNVKLQSQYISSTAGWKGIQFESGMDEWMTIPKEGTTHTLQNGVYIEDKLYAVHKDAWKQYPEIFGENGEKCNELIEEEEVAYISRYQDRLYQVESCYDEEENTFYYILGDAITKAPEELDEIVSKGVVTLADGSKRENVSLREMLNDGDYLYESYIVTACMDPFQFPDIHTNVYCDMTFSGGQTGVHLSFPEGSDNQVTFMTKVTDTDPITLEPVEKMIPVDDGTFKQDSESRTLEIVSLEGITYKVGVTIRDGEQVTPDMDSTYDVDGEKVVMDKVTADQIKDLSEEQQDKIQNGSTLNLSVKADTVDEKTIAEPKKKEINDFVEKNVDNKEFGMELLDINLSAKIDGEKEETKVTSLKTPTTVRIPVSKELADRIKTSLNQKKNCFIVRYHEWAGSKTDVDRLPLQLVEENGKFYITFRTDRFSLYAIAYEKAALDISKVQWKTTAFTYDGQVKKVELEGMPEDVKVTYAGQFSAAEPGTYTATATFDYDTEKYATADFSKFASVQWTITKAAENPPVVTPGAPVRDNPAQPAAPSTIAQPEPAGVVAGASLTVAGNTYQVLTADGTKTVAITGADKKAAKVAIPQTIQFNGEVFTVTSIAANAFKNCKNLKTVVIPKTVTTIGKNAFSGAKKLKKITIQGTAITSIGKNAFKNVNKKAVVKVPKSKKKAYKKLLKKAGYKGKVK